MDQNVSTVSFTTNGCELVVEIARVSSERKNKRAAPQKLLTYLIEHNHWSPFEHAYMTVRIVTSRVIAAQLLRHRSFTFQEFSQRYSNVKTHGEVFYQPIELRMQDIENKQSSNEVLKDPILEFELSTLLDDCHSLYDLLIGRGVARECARLILPMCTTTVIYMTGNIRSWYHFIRIRRAKEAQKEIRSIAIECERELFKNFPLLCQALSKANNE